MCFTFNGVSKLFRGRDYLNFIKDWKKKIFTEVDPFALLSIEILENNKLF